MARFFCKKCGFVDRYYTIEHIRRCLIFDSDNNPNGSMDDMGIYQGRTKRCVECGGRVIEREVGE